MYLSRLILNPRSRAVRRDLADCQAMHRTIMSAFPDIANCQDARARLGVLYRLDPQPRTGVVTLLVQSGAAPDWSRLEADYLWDTGGDPRNPDSKCVDGPYARLRNGMVLVFRLRANPTKKIDTKSGPDGERRNGKRVELQRESDQLEWLARKARDGGFELLSVRADPAVADVRATPGGKLKGRKPGDLLGDGAEESSRLTFGSVLFEGELRVTDAEVFRDTLQHGIGSGKAYGFGLLSVIPPREDQYAGSTHSTQGAR